MKFKKFLTDGTFSSGSSYTIYSGPDGEVEVFKRGSKFYGDAGDFDFDAKNLKDLKTKLKDWGYTTHQAGKDLRI